MAKEERAHQHLLRNKKPQGDDEDEKNKESGKPARSHPRRSACRLERALNISRACVRVLFLLFIAERERERVRLFQFCDLWCTYDDERRRRFLGAWRVVW